MAENRSLSIVDTESSSLATVDLFNDDRLKLIRNMTAQGAPDHLFMAMIEIARVRGLDPLAKQISLINFGGQWQITTTIDGYRALAERTGAYAGSDPAIFTESGEFLANGKAVPMTATVTVWKLVHGERRPFSATVYWDEYYGGDKNFTWNKMPRTMLAKVAESHALRKAFPTVLSGVYTAEEMDQSGPVVTGEIVDHDTGEIVRSGKPAPANRPAQPRPSGSVSVQPPAGAPAAPKASPQALTDLTALAARKTVNVEDLTTMAWFHCGAATLEDLDGRGVHKLNKMLAESEGDIAGYVLNARDARQNLEGHREETKRLADAYHAERAANGK